MPGANVRPDPLDVMWIEMSMRQLTNQALGLYLASESNLPHVRDAIIELSEALIRLGGPIDSGQVQCPPNYSPCPLNPRACCPHVRRPG